MLHRGAGVVLSVREGHAEPPAHPGPFQRDLAAGRETLSGWVSLYFVGFTFSVAFLNTHREYDEMHYDED